MVAVPSSEVEEFVGKLSTDEKLFFLGEKTIGRLGCFGCHIDPGIRERQADRHARSTTGASKSPTRLDYGHIHEYIEDQKQDDNGDRDGTDPFYQEQLEARDPDGLPLPEAAPPAELRLPEEERGVQDLGRSPADAPVRLGQRPGRRRGGHDLRPRPHRREDRQPGTWPRASTTTTKIALAKGAKVLNRYNCTGCHVARDAQVHDPGGRRRRPRRSPTSRRTCGPPTPPGAPTTSPSSTPTSSFDPKKKLDAESIEAELGIAADDRRRRSRSRACRPACSRTS